MTKSYERDRMCLVFATVSGQNVTFKQIPSVEFDNEAGRYFLPKLADGKVRNEKQFRENWEDVMKWGGINAISGSVIRTDINVNSLRQMPVWEDMTPRDEISAQDWQAMTPDQRKAYSEPVLTKSQKEAALASFAAFEERERRSNGGNVLALKAA